MSFEFNNEKALDVLIWWVEGSDGSIEYEEEQKVKEVLSDMNYSKDIYYQDTLMYIGSLPTEKLDDLVEDAISYAKQNYSKHDKQKTVSLLHAIAKSNDNVKEGEREKIDRLKNEFGVKELGYFEEE
jgi:uncharacterized tellurite resistance protein B-like protein